MLTLPFAAIAASKPLRSLENNGPHTFCLPLSDTPQVCHTLAIYIILCKHVASDGAFPNLWMSFP